MTETDSSPEKGQGRWELTTRVHGTIMCRGDHYLTEGGAVDHINALEAELTALRAQRDGFTLECNEVEQVLGKALGYPWYKDDLKNFPGATEADGVCVGDHVPGTIAAEAADLIIALRARLEAAEAYKALAVRLGTQVRIKRTTIGDSMDEYLSLVNGGDFDPYSWEELEDILYEWLKDYDALEKPAGGNAV